MMCLYLKTRHHIHASFSFVTWCSSIPHLLLIWHGLEILTFLPACLSLGSILEWELKSLHDSGQSHRAKSRKGTCFVTSIAGQSSGIIDKGWHSGSQCAWICGKESVCRECKFPFWKTFLLNQFIRNYTKRLWISANHCLGVKGFQGTRTIQE